jgi:hypothetical protein
MKTCRYSSLLIFTDCLHRKGICGSGSFCWSLLYDWVSFLWRKFEARYKIRDKFTARRSKWTIYLKKIRSKVQDMR